MTYEEWMKEVDKAMVNSVGVDTLMIADANYRDMYDDEIEPVEAAQQALLNDDSFACIFGNDYEF